MPHLFCFAHLSPICGGLEPTRWLKHLRRESMNVSSEWGVSGAAVLPDVSLLPAAETTFCRQHLDFRGLMSELME